MKNVPLISICIPVYNRKKNLLKLLRSIDHHKDLEIVIFDDGSTDRVKDLLFKQYPFKIRFFRTKNNRGRSPALSDAILNCFGLFTIIMDSDDYFLPGAIKLILSKIKKYKNIKSFVFGIKIFRNSTYKKNLPPRNMLVNLLKLRADFRVKGDLKEVVKTDLLKKCIYKNSYKFKRTPTSLIWFSLSNLTKSLTIDSPVIVKKYYKSGMSNEISKLKFENAEPMYHLYCNYSKSKLYKSYYFRIRSKVLCYRYLKLSKKKIKFKLKDLVYIFIGHGLYLYDMFIFRLLINKS